MVYRLIKNYKNLDCCKLIIAGFEAGGEKISFQRGGHPLLAVHYDIMQSESLKFNLYIT